MAGGYPNLFPSGFIEFDDDCSGPLLYRNQPSRENADGITLNAFMDKYSGAEITNYDFLNLLTYIKYINRHWNKIPERTRSEIITMLNSSNGNLKLNPMKNQIEHFADDTPEPEKKKDPDMNVLTLVIVSIVCIIIGFLICIISTN